MSWSSKWTVVSVLGALLSSHAHGCIHDTLPRQLTTSSQQYDSNHPFIQGEQRQLREQAYYTTTSQQYDRSIGNSVDDSVYRPIRITPYYDNSTLGALSDDKRDVISRVIPDAIHYFQQALQVVPVQGNLSAQHSCNKKWSTVPIVCNTFVEDETCFEMPIPQEHFGATRRCSNCLQTGCGGNSNCTYSPAGGVPETDFLLYVRAVSTNLCVGKVLAYAMACQKDQFDRPTFGMVNFCPSKIKSDYDDLLTTAVHEITHALGFSSTFYAYMRHPDGMPRTPRDANGEPPIQTTGQCHNGNSVRYEIVPGAETVEYSTERGHSVAKLVTPNVAAYVQDHFNCSTLTGAELESNDPGCIGSHWEERLFESEYMSPVLSFRNVLSGLTLAFFEDSGWYRTNVSKAQRMVFGEKRGCSFATDKCVNPVTAQPLAADHYCTSNAAESCSVDATSRSVCSIQSGLSIPSVFQYFGSDTSKGGANAYADYCPLNVGFSGGDCAIESNLNAPPGTSVNILGETYCPTCKCTTTSLRSDDSTRWAVTSRRATGCYAMKCHWDGSTVASIEIAIPRSKSMDSVAVNCTAVGEKMRVEGFSGELTCPDPFIICGSTFATKSDAATGVDETQTTSSSGSNASGSASSYDNMEVAPPSTPNPNRTSTDGSFATSTISNVSASGSGESQTSASFSPSSSSSTSTSGSLCSSPSMSNSESHGNDEASSSSSVSLYSSGSASTSGSFRSGSMSASSSSSSFAYSSSGSAFADSRSNEGSVGGSLGISSSSSSRSSSLDDAGYTIPSDTSAPVSTLEPISNSESSHESLSGSAGSASTSSASREGSSGWQQNSDESDASSGSSAHATAGSINDSAWTSSSSSATSASSVASPTDVGYGGVVSDDSAPTSTLSGSGLPGVSLPISASSMSAARSTSGSSSSSYRQSSSSASESSASQTASSSTAQPAPSMTPSPESSSLVPFSTLSSSSDSRSGEDSTPTVLVPIRETAAPRSTVAGRVSEPTTVPGPTEGATVRSADGNGAGAATSSLPAVVIGIAMLLVQT